MSSKTIMNRRSVRSFRPKPVSKPLLRKIIYAAQRAPTNCGIQPYSFVSVSDPRLRESIVEIVGKQKAMLEAPVWLIVCVDYARPFQLFKLIGIHVYLGEACRLVNGLMDAALATENLVIAAESNGLGSVIIGSVWASPTKIAALLNLPRGVMPILMVCLGYPASHPPRRPRWPREAVLHENQYREPSTEEMLSYYKSGTRALLRTGYFRKGISNWAEHWQAKFKPDRTPAWETNLRQELQDLGFLPKTA